MRRIALVGFTLLILTSLCPPVQAYGPPGSDGEWDFVVTPYIWLPARSDITSTIEGQSVDMYLTFSDILENFDVFALSASFEAWKNRFGFIFGGYWMKLNTSKAIASPGPFDVTLNIDKVDIQQAIFDFAASYRLLQRPLRQGRSLPALYFEPIAGLRVNYLKQKVDLTLQGPIRDRSAALGDEFTWVGLMLGGRVKLQVIEKLSLAVRGSVSGFGIGDGSDLQWDFLAGADYRPWRIASFKAGYRVYQIDYSTGSGRDEFGYDATQHGPLLGVSFYF